MSRGLRWGGQEIVEAVFNPGPDWHFITIFTVDVDQLHGFYQGCGSGSRCFSQCGS